MPEVALERKLRRFSTWIVDAMLNVAFERTCCVETILISLFYVLTEVTNLLCMDRRCHAKYSVRTEFAIVLGVDSRQSAGHSVPMELLHGKDITFSFRRSGGSNRLTLCA